MRYLIVVALALAGCGGSGPVEPDVGPPESGLVFVRGVSGFEDPTRLGEYEDVGGDGWVRIRLDLLPNDILTIRTIMHELGHAAGLHHTSDRCLMDPSAAGVLEWVPCPHEVAGLAPGVIQVSVEAGVPLLLQRTKDAASNWNMAAGRAVFVVL